MTTPPQKQYVDGGPCYQCGHAFVDHRFSDGGPEPCAVEGCSCAYYWIKVAITLDVKAATPAAR